MTVSFALHEPSLASAAERSERKNSDIPCATSANRRLYSPNVVPDDGDSSTEICQSQFLQ